MRSAKLAPENLSPFTLPDRVTSRVAIVSIVAVAVILLTIASFTLLNLLRTSAQLDALARSTSAGDAITQMTLAATLAGAHYQRYIEFGDENEKPQVLAFMQQAVAADAQARKYASPAEVASLDAIEQRFGPETAAATQIMTNPDPNISRSNDPTILDEFVASLTAPEQASRDQAALDLASARDGFAHRAVAVLLAFAAGLPMLGLLFVVIFRYERKDAVKAAELKRLSQAALTDGLTGLGNHRAFQEDLRREVSRASRSERPISVAMIDIDDFKEINDSLGHARGDAVLAELGKLMSFLRAEDRSYRVGGDEFALIMPDADAQHATSALDRLRQSVEDSIPGVTLSLGVSTNLLGERNAARLRDHADLALYEAKHRGKNQVVTYDSELDHGNSLTATKMNALREVLKSAQVTMVFQPIFQIGSNHLLAYEALLRLPQAPQIAGPEEAFEIAQHMGRSRDLDLLCASGALDAARALPDDVRIFINLDPATLMHSEFSARELLALVTERGIKPAKVVFEITEKTSAPLPRLARQVGALQECGFGVAIDDVGSGNSGLEMLRLMKFDYVKIDRSVILDAMNDGPGRAVILAIVAFARESGAFMIAEGIENKAMLEGIKFDEAGLRKYWVQGVQGFMFGEPRSSMGDPDSAPAVAA